MNYYLIYNDKKGGDIKGPYNDFKLLFKHKDYIKRSLEGKAFCMWFSLNGTEVASGPYDFRDSCTILANNLYRTIQVEGLSWLAEDYYKGGEHFTWEEAMKNAPEGWRLPTLAEAEDLLVHFSNLDGKFMNGEVDLNYKGYMVREDITSAGEYGLYWTSANWDQQARCFYIRKSSGDARTLSYPKEWKFSVRYVKSK